MLQTCIFCIVLHLFIQQNVKKCTWHQTGQTMDETHQCISALDNFQKLSFKAFSQMTPFLLRGGIFAPWILLKVELFGFQAASDRAIFWRNYASKYQLFVQFNLTFYRNMKVFLPVLLRLLKNILLKKLHLKFLKHMNRGKRVQVVEIKRSRDPLPLGN